MSPLIFFLQFCLFLHNNLLIFIKSMLISLIDILFIVLYNYFVVFLNFSDKEERLWQKQQSSLAVQEELDGLYH